MTSDMAHAVELAKARLILWNATQEEEPMDYAWFPTRHESPHIGRTALGLPKGQGFTVGVIAREGTPPRGFIVVVGGAGVLGAHALAVAGYSAFPDAKRFDVEHECRVAYPVEHRVLADPNCAVALGRKEEAKKR